jgi:hypothetical protein
MVLQRAIMLNLDNIHHSKSGMEGTYIEPYVPETGGPEIYTYPPTCNLHLILYPP